MLAKPESPPAPSKTTPEKAREHLLQEVQNSFKAAAVSPQPDKALTHAEQAMVNLASFDGGPHSAQFHKDVSTLNARMEPTKSLTRDLPLLQIVGLDSRNHVQFFDQADGKVERLVVDTDGMLRPVAPLDSKIDHRLYAMTGKGDDWHHAIQPRFVQQARFGDCYFLAGVQALAAKHPELIRKMIHNNGAQADGRHSFTVRFPGANDKPITVNEPNIFEVTAGAQDGGGLWANVLEKAHRKLTNRGLVDHGDTIQSANGFALLTGNTPKPLNIAHTKMETELEQINKSDVIAITDSNAKGGVIIDNHGNHVQIVGGHMYSLLHYDKKAGTVTVGNPWGENRAESTGSADPGNIRVHSKFDAIFNADLAEPKNVTRIGARLTMTLADYKKHFVYFAAIPVKKQS